MLGSRTGGLAATALPALMAAAAGMLGGSAKRDAGPALQYSGPRVARHSNQRTQRGPGKSPARSGPHSEPQVHVRGANGVHHWFTVPQWHALRPGHFGQPGDLIERVNGYGQVTGRLRVPA